MKTRGWSIVLLLAALALRVASAYSYWSWFDERHPQTWAVSKIALSPDGSQYVQQADPGTWASHLHRSWSDRAFFRPPLPSYYFAGLLPALNFDRLAVSFVQSFLAVFAYWLIYLVVLRRIGVAAALATLAVLALHPVLMFFDSSLEDSSLGLLCLALTVFTTDWARDGGSLRWLAPGTAAGLAVLARPQFAILVLGLGILAWLAQRRFRALAAFGVSVLYVVAPAVWHNHSASGRWSLVSDTFGQNLYWGNGPNPEYRTSVLGYWNIWELDQGSPSSLLVEGLKRRTGQNSADSAFLTETTRSMSDHPGQALATIAEKAWRHLSSYEIPRTCNFPLIRGHVPVWRIPYLPFALVLGLALLGVRGLERRTAWLLMLPWLATLFTELLFFNASRYRALALPFLVPLAMRGLFSVIELIRTRRWRELAMPGTLLAGLALLGATAVTAKERDRHEAAQYFIESMMESYADEFGGWNRFSEERFQHHLGLARQIDPDNLDAFSVEQKLRLREGKIDEASAAIQARRARCRAGEWLCEDVCDQLATIAHRSRASL